MDPARSKDEQVELEPRKDQLWQFHEERREALHGCSYFLFFAKVICTGKVPIPVVLTASANFNIEITAIAVS